MFFWALVRLLLNCNVSSLHAGDSGDNNLQDWLKIIYDHGVLVKDVQPHWCKENVVVAGAGVCNQYGR